MRIIDIRERSVSLSRYADRSLPSGGLTTSMVAVGTDIVRDGKPVVGFGFSSFGRFAQGGLIRERFAPRLLGAIGKELWDPAEDNIDPFRAWTKMMAGEKPSGHGERCVAVGTLDMAIWDAAAKAAGLPLYAYLARKVGRESVNKNVKVYAGGGYPYPGDDIAQLSDEVRHLRDLGYTRAKIKIGNIPIAQDRKRIDAAGRVLENPSHLAVDAMNLYDRSHCVAAAAKLSDLGLWWFEDICDPLDFETWAQVASTYPGPLAAGEALFSAAEAKLLDRYSGLRPDRDILLFDPVHCYGLPEYLRIIHNLEGSGWRRQAFWPHGGHLFSLHVVQALGLGGAEVNPLGFQPFGGFGENTVVENGEVAAPDAPGIGVETKQDLADLFDTLL